MTIKERLVTEEVKGHETSTSVVEASIAKFDAGADMALKVKVSCSSACDLRGNIVIIMAQDAAVKQIELGFSDGTVNETDDFVVKTPTMPGEYTWTAVFPAQEKEGVLHEESSAPFSFTVKPHTTSMAVWDAPSPIVSGAKFRLKVGVRCSAECNLGAKEIEIYNHEGAKVATGTLGGAPWSGTSALYWAEVELEAPSTEGRYTWTVRFPKPDLGLPHEGSAGTFAFATAKPPEHVVAVEVIDKDKKTPIKGAQVVLHPYRGCTDDAGVARVSVPKGEYRVCVFKDEYADFQTSIEVTENAALKAELRFWPAYHEYYRGRQLD